MGQCRQLRTNRRDPRGLDFGRDHAFAFGPHREHAAPRVDHHAVAEGAATVLVPSALRCSDHVALVLNRSRAQQQLPVRKTGGVGEGRGHRDQVAEPGALGKAQRAVELGKAQVVASLPLSLSDSLQSPSSPFLPSKALTVLSSQSFEVFVIICMSFSFCRSTILSPLSLQ